MVMARSKTEIGKLTAQCWADSGGSSQRGAELEVKRFVEALHTCLLGLSDTVPLPRERWFDEVLVNYGIEASGTIEAFTDVVDQYYSYHLNKRVDCRSSELPLEFKASVVFPIHNRIKVYHVYEHVKPIGKGAFGSVDVVRHRATSKLWACKTIRTPTAQHVELAETEISLLQQLNHPNLLRLSEVYRSGDHFFIISELCEGGSLAEKLKAAPPGYPPIPEATAAKWMYQILSCLSYLHRMGIAHRDLKGDNCLFLTRQEDTSPLKLIDFGLSSHLAAIQRRTVDPSRQRSQAREWLSKVKNKALGRELEGPAPMQRAGTLHYMSPEMIRGEYGVKSDCWSAGVVLHQMLSGCHPFYTAGVDTEESVQRKILHEEVPLKGYPWDSLSLESKDLIARLLTKKDKTRISACQGMEHPWLSGQSAPDRVNHSRLTMSVLDILRDWSHVSDLKQAVLKLLVARVGDNELHELRYLFEKIDRQGTGVVSLDQLKRVMSEAGLVTECDDELEAMIRSISCGSRAIGYNQFLASFVEQRRMFGCEDYRQVFRQLDTEGEGFLTVPQLCRLFEDPFVLTDRELAFTVESKCGKPDRIPIGDRILTEEGFIRIMTTVI